MYFTGVLQCCTSMFYAMSEAAEILVDDVGESYGLRWRRRSEVDIETCPIYGVWSYCFHLFPSPPGTGLTNANICS